MSKHFLKYFSYSSTLHFFTTDTKSVNSSLELRIWRFGKEGGRPGPLHSGGVPCGSHADGGGVFCWRPCGAQGAGTAPLLDARAPFYRSPCENGIKHRCTARICTVADKYLFRFPGMHSGLSRLRIRHRQIRRLAPPPASIHAMTAPCMKSR